ncbi:hypothetical protein SEA_ATUIN_48 [Arthrobacter phage Atuin]|nr:hypothetical protein SEA_ATUIN_147 [Arthrobacter phage Atuin]
MHTNTTGSDTDRNPPMYVDIRIGFKEVYKTWTDGDNFEDWYESEPLSISRVRAVNVNDFDMYDVVEKIMESNDREKFLNGILESIYGKETTFSD